MMRPLLLLLALAVGFDACVLMKEGAVATVRPTGHAWSDIERGLKPTHTGQWFKIVKVKKDGSYVYKNGKVVKK